MDNQLFNPEREDLRDLSGKLRMNDELFMGYLRGADFHTDQEKAEMFTFHCAIRDQLRELAKKEGG